MKHIYIVLVVALMAFTAQAQIDRSVMPKPGPAPEINLQEAERFELSNGLKVLVVENHKLPRVSIQLRLDNNPILEGNKAGVSSLTGSLLGNGSKSISKDAFNEEVDFLGARLNFGPQSAFASSLSKYFPRILELLADAAINPNFTQEEFEKEKEKLITGLKTQEKDVSAIARRVQNALAYGTNHPYGEFTSESTVNNVTLADVDKFYTDYFVPANAYLVIIGDVDFKETQKLVKKNFSSWIKATPPSLQFTNPTNTQYTQINFIDVPNAVQSEVAVQSLVGLQMKDQDYLSALIANQILGGGGEGRLFLNLREDKAYTYGSYSRLGNDKHGPSTFRATASVRNAVTDSSVVEILKEMDRIIKEPVSDKELKATKAKYVGNFVMALEKPETIANYALNIETEGLPQDYYKTYLERINAITVQDVQNAAQKYLTTSNARVVVTGKGSEVLENLGKISRNGKTVPVKYFDKYAKPTPKPDYNKAAPKGVTAKSVLQKYIDAVGGADKLKAVGSVYIVAEGNMQGMTINYEQKKTANKQFMQDVKVMGNSMSKQVLNADKGYMVMQGQRKELESEEINTFISESYPFIEMTLLDSANIKFEGIEAVDGKDAYMIKLLDKKTAFYDVESGLKVKEVSRVEGNGQTMEVPIGYGDYKEVGGIKFPFIYKQSMGPQVLELVVKEIKVNEGVSDVDFD